MRWWTLSGEKAAGAIQAALGFLHQYQSTRLQQYARSSRLYGNLPLISLNGISYSQAAMATPAMRDRISYNVIQSCVDTVTAKISKNKPKPLFLTSDGDYVLQRKAKKLNQFVDGIFYENKTYELGVSAFRDSAVIGDGIVHVFAENDRAKHERVMASELFVDEIEGFYGAPRSMYRVKNIDRSVLLDAWSGKKSLIGDSGATLELGDRRDNLADLVTVREAWHLPSGPEASDGKHIIAIDGGVLLSEPWKHDFFPFARLPWCPRLFGFWSQALAEQLENIQLEVNKLLWTIQRSMQLAGSFKVLLENGSKIVSEKLNNEIGALIRYTGTPPQYVLPPIVPPEIYQHLGTLKQQAFEQAGISQLSAASQKPAGLNSGKALREFNDIESDRFTTIGHAYENFYLDIARLSIAVAKDIAAENDGRYAVNVPGRKFLASVDWKDVDLEEEDYVMQCYPVSSLPSDPAGRLETVQEYMQAGLISPRQGKRLLDFPDLDRIEGLQNAAEDYLTMVLEKIVDDGELTPPEPFDDIQLAREMALEFYARGKTQNLEPERLELLRTFISQLDQLQQMASPPAAPAAPPGATPQAAPMPPPQSDLLPNAPGIAGLQ